MSDWMITGICVLTGVLVLYAGRRVLVNQNSYPCPPGPRGLSWIGDVMGINAASPRVTFAEWAKKYGDIVYYQVLGRGIIMINSEKVAQDLFEKRSKNYSDRPLILSNELFGMDFNSAMKPYGDTWRLHRRFFHQTFRRDAVSRFLPLQHQKSCQLLRRLFDAPDQLHEHVFQYTVSVILRSTYDYDPVSDKDEMVDVMARTLAIIVPDARPVVAMVIDAFPLLRHLPSWLPGMGIIKRMATARMYAEQYVERPFGYSLERVKMPGNDVASGPCMVHDGLRHIEEKAMPSEYSRMRLALKEASGTAFMAGADTSHSALMTFFLMMMLNPGAQEKAQAQIDAVVGKSRLPEMEDRPLLPFVDAIFWETLRYNPVVPLAVPHAALNDDIYDGFRIPKGSLILTNLWWMAHDESKFADPHAFIPERFLNDDGSLNTVDVKHIAFGFGRRMCVGRYFAETSAWAVITRVLAVFKILKPLDENGMEVSVEPRFSGEMLSHPLPFKCRILPRFPEMDLDKLEALITSSRP